MVEMADNNASHVETLTRSRKTEDMANKNSVMENLLMAG